MAPKVFGAEDCKVLEHLDLKLAPSRRAVMVFEIEGYPEPKALSPADLRAVAVRYGGNKPAARAIGGVSEGFIRQNCEMNTKSKT